MEGSKERDLVVFTLREMCGKLVTSIVNKPRKKKKRRLGVTATENIPDEYEHADMNNIVDDSEDDYVDYSVRPRKLNVQDRVNLLSSQTREVKDNINDLNQGGQTLTLKLDVIQVTVEAITIEANHLWGKFGAVSRDVVEVVRMVDMIRVKIEAVKENLKVVSADGELVHGKIEAVEEKIAEVRNVTVKMEEVEEGIKMDEVEEGMAEDGNTTDSNETSELRICTKVELPDVCEMDTSSRFGREIDEPESNERLDDHDGPMVDQQRKERWKADNTKRVELGETKKKGKTDDSDEETLKSISQAVNTKAGKLGKKKEERKREKSGEHREMNEKRKVDEGKEKRQIADYSKTGKHVEMKRTRKNELYEIIDAAELTEDSDCFDICDSLTVMDYSSDDSDTNDSLGDVQTRKSESPRKKTGVTKSIDKVGECDEVGIIDKFLDDTDEVDEGMEEWKRENKGEMEVETHKYGAFENFLESEELSDDCNDDIVDDYYEERETAGVSDGPNEIRDEMVKIYIEIGEINKDIEEFKTGVKSSEGTGINKVKRKRKPSQTTKCVCDECGKVLANPKSLQRHKKGHTRPKKPEKEHRCLICGRLFQQKWTLRSHMKIHSHIPVECKRCGQVCRTQGMYIHHMTTHGVFMEGGEVNQCDLCGKVFSTSEILARHQQNHIKPRPHNYECTYCSRRFLSQIHLDEHVAMHTGKKDFICEVCGKAFGGKHGLREHQMSHLPEKRFHCEICHKRFSRQGNYRRHLNIHTGVRKCQCLVCGRFFRDSGNLKSHMKSHSRNKTHRRSNELVTCDICHKTYTNKTSLEIHILLTHLETSNLGRETVDATTPLNCSICNKTFTALHTLKLHMRSHIKHIKCQLCGRAFSSNQSLDAHMASHTGEKNYPCDVCGRSFSAPSNMRRHKHVMHSEDSETRTVECHICGKSFKFIEYLKAHIKTHNKVKGETKRDKRDRRK